MRPCFVLLVVVWAFSAQPIAAQTVTPPTESGYAGVPAPAFGLGARPGTITHFVDNTHIMATDTNNPSGTAARPRRTVPRTLPAGAVVEVRGGPYSPGSLTLTAQGTADRPVYVFGVGKPLFQGNGAGDRLVLAGSFMVVDGFTFDGVKQELYGTSMALRNSIVRNTNTVAVVVMNRGGVLYNNEIHHNGDATATIERDTHGVLVLPGTKDTWILANHVHHNGGDGVQVGNSSGVEPLAEYVYIAGNVLHEDRENGVDIKAARHVFVSTNRIAGYYERSSSAGEAIVVHNNPSYVWILNNWVGASHQGIVCTGAYVYTVMGNVIANVRGGSLSPSNLYSSSGILTYSSNVTFHLNNTISGSDAGISIGGSTRTEVLNNIVTGLTQPTVPIRFSSSTTKAASNVLNNYTGADPGFVDPAKGDFRLKSTAAAPVDGGYTFGLSEAFKNLYSLPLRVDLYGGQRLVGAKIDIGAAEYQTPR